VTAAPRVSGVPLAVCIAAIALVGTFAEIHGSPQAPPAPAYAIAVLAAAVLCLRHRAPVTVATVIVLASLAYHLLGYPGLAPAVALFVAIPTVTALGDGPRSWVVAGILVLAVSAVPMLPPRPATAIWGIVGPGGMLVALAALGEATRMRRIATAEQIRAVQRTAEEDARARIAEERLRIAREVHDVLAHTITVITVQAAAAADALDERPEDTREALGAVREAARAAMVELRGTLTLLRGGGPEPLAPQPGLDELPALVERARAGGLAVTVTTTGRLDAVTGALELTVYRIVQEALTNTVRHSRSTAADVTIALGPGEVAVDVVDTGPALHPRFPGGGHGLTGMAERVRAFGGTVDAGPRPAPSTGFRVAARIPLGLAARGTG
jgi:signal transduction histidine kinase